MSTRTDTSGTLFGRFPYDTVILPSTVAGLVVTTGLFLIDVATKPQFSVTVENVVLALIGAIATIGLLVAVLGIVVSGAGSDVLVVGAILTYVAGLITILLESIYNPGSLSITADLFILPLREVVLAVGIGIGVNWIGVDVSL